MAAQCAARPLEPNVKTRRWIALWLAAGATAGASVMAQDPPSAAGTPLGRAVDAAWQRAVVAQEARGREQVAMARRIAAQAWTSQAPAAELSRRHGPSGARETELGLAAPVWLPNRRSSVRAAADSELEVARCAERVARWHLAGEVRELAWALASQQAELGAAQEQLQSLQTLAADVQRRVQAGDLARSDALVANAEVLSAQAAAAELRQRSAETAVRWSALTGLAAWIDPGEPDVVAPEPLAHPEIVLAHSEVERARRRAEEVRLARRDPPEVALSWRQERADTVASRQNSIGVALRIPFGTDARTGAAEAAALAELDLAHVQLERLSERLALELRAARDAVELARRQQEAERSRAALLRERAQLLDKSFRAGETSLPDLLRAQAAAAQAVGALARRNAAWGLARARLHQILGVTP